MSTTFFDEYRGEPELTEFVGLTKAEARELRHKKYVAYLRSTTRGILAADSLPAESIIWSPRPDYVFGKSDKTQLGLNWRSAVEGFRDRLHERQNGCSPLSSGCVAVAAFPSSAGFQNLHGALPKSHC